MNDSNNEDQELVGVTTEKLAAEADGQSGLVGRELDAAIAEHVMGFTVKGTAVCDRDPDCNGLEIMPLSDVANSTKGTETHPVYTHKCYCADCPVIHVTYPKGSMKHIEIEANARNIAEHNADLEQWGHSRACLEVVPHYSTDIAAAMQVVEKMNHYPVEIHDAFLQQLTRNNPNYEPWKVVGWVLSLSNMPEWICRAALAALEATSQHAEGGTTLPDQVESSLPHQTESNFTDLEISEGSVYCGKCGAEFNPEKLK